MCRSFQINGNYSLLLSFRQILGASWLDKGFTSFKTKINSQQWTCCYSSSEECFIGALLRSLWNILTTISFFANRMLFVTLCHSESDSFVFQTLSDHTSQCGQFPVIIKEIIWRKKGVNWKGRTHWRTKMWAIRKVIKWLNQWILKQPVNLVEAVPHQIRAKTDFKLEL